MCSKAFLTSSTTNRKPAGPRPISPIRRDDHGREEVVDPPQTAPEHEPPESMPLRKIGLQNHAWRWADGACRKIAGNSVLLPSVSRSAVGSCGDVKRNCQFTRAPLARVRAADALPQRPAFHSGARDLQTI
jgi:hypothetical protein